MTGNPGRLAACTLPLTWVVSRRETKDFTSVFQFVDGPMWVLLTTCSSSSCKTLITKLISNACRPSTRVRQPPPGSPERTAKPHVEGTIRCSGACGKVLPATGFHSSSVHSCENVFECDTPLPAYKRMATY